MNKRSTPSTTIQSYENWILDTIQENPSAGMTGFMQKHFGSPNIISALHTAITKTTANDIDTGERLWNEIAWRTCIRKVEYCNQITEQAIIHMASTRDGFRIAINSRFEDNLEASIFLLLHETAHTFFFGFDLTSYQAFHHCLHHGQQEGFCDLFAIKLFSRIAGYELLSLPAGIHPLDKESLCRTL